MIDANRDIIILNQKLDPVTRKPVYIPTQISGVSVYDKNNASSTGAGYKSSVYKIRIPLSAHVMNARNYLCEAQYDKLTAYESAAFWTIHNDDIIIVCTDPFSDVNTPVFEIDVMNMQHVRQLDECRGYYRDVIKIVNFSDNTMRGSKYLRHWRIEGV